MTPSDGSQSPSLRKAADFFYRLSRPLISLGIIVGRLSSWLVLLNIVAVLTTVFLNTIGLSEIARWNQSILLFGNAVTINSITELQWHIFSVLILLGTTYALHHDSHVRVDIIYHRLSIKQRAAVDITGHLLLLIPFCLIIAWLSQHFVTMSYISGEQSDYGGLNDRYLIKAFLPLSLIFLAIGAFGQVLKQMAILLDPEPSKNIPNESIQ